MNDLNQEQVDYLNHQQHYGKYHPKTCMSFYCNRGSRDDEGILIATKNYWICPCGKLIQNYDMTKEELIKEIQNSGKDLIKEQNQISEQEKQAIKNGK